ncbi:hypothetical protein JIQ42_07405 [Leishmania sp. Namibia]|uniref:hypothetical protein n=1 Tax=Leishmania sp. Namibia TaxID=2802991 RepID=UPI001B40CE16|nr:hypothetical protein JIQ42_07405 [Leishmania sp. Namibia]
MRGRQCGAARHDAGTPQRPEDVFGRLSQCLPTSLSSYAFDAVAAHQQQEASQCTFLPRVNHTHDAALIRWAAGSDVFTRLYGHARCQQQRREDAAEAKRKADAAEVDEWHVRFRHVSFPKHLYAHAQGKEDHATDSATARIAPPKRGTHIISALHTNRRSAHATVTGPRTRPDNSRPSAAVHGAAALSVARAEVWLSRMRTAYLSRVPPRNERGGTA